MTRERALLPPPRLTPIARGSCARTFFFARPSRGRLSSSRSRCRATRRRGTSAATCPRCAHAQAARFTARIARRAMRAPVGSLGGASRHAAPLRVRRRRRRRRPARSTPPPPCSSRGSAVDGGAVGAHAAGSSRGSLRSTRAPRSRRGTRSPRRACALPGSCSGSTIRIPLHASAALRMERPTPRHRHPARRRQTPRSHRPSLG